WETSTGKALGPPLPHHAGILAAAFGPDGKSVLTGVADGTARLWHAWPPLEDTAKRITDWLAVVTGLKLDGNGMVHVLDADNWSKFQWRREEGGGLSRAGEGPPAREWGEGREAAECEQQQQWFAAAFYLPRLIARQPADGGLYVRRGRAHAELGAWPKAAQD